MKLKIRTIEDMLYDGAEAEVYKGIIRKTEIGRIGMIANVDSGYFKIEYFVLVSKTFELLFSLNFLVVLAYI